MVSSKRVSVALAAWGILALALAGCGEKTGGLQTLHERTIGLPGGQRIQAEVMTSPLEMQRGMMFRDELPRGRGMLFIHAKEGNYGYWMFQVRIPLDIIFINSNRQIVEIAPNVPPCKTRASECPSYGGKELARYVLEIGAGEAERLHLHVGTVLDY